MKRLFLTVALLLAFSAGLYAQSVHYISLPERGDYEVFTKMYCITEGDYVFNTAGTADDTSSVIKIRGDKSWNQIWARVTCDQDSASGTTRVDSVDVVCYFDIKPDPTMKSAAANYGLGWNQCDSMKIVTADSLDGVYKELAIPAGTEQIRMRIDGVTGNGTVFVTATEAWLIFKR